MVFDSSPEGAYGREASQKGNNCIFYTRIRFRSIAFSTKNARQLHKRIGYVLGTSDRFGIWYDTEKETPYGRKRGIGMNNAQQKALVDRNERILSAVIRKAKDICPDAVDLIGIAGSFHTGDIHPYSDLDLCIVINDDTAWKISSCFILGDVAHDIYCTPWNRLEEMAACKDPYVTKLFELGIVYQRNEEALQRYLSLRAAAAARLSSPLCGEDCDRADVHVAEASRIYADLMLADETGTCRYAAAGLLLASEYAVYLYNKTYVRRGIRRIPEELAAMPLLPERYLDLHRLLVAAPTADMMKSTATELLRSLKAFAKAMRAFVSSRSPLTAEALRGTYEEIHSNWKNKMRFAAETGDAYLSLMTAASCQQFYGEMSDRFEMERIDLMRHVPPDDLSGAAEAFDRAMEAYRTHYDRLQAPVVSYADLDAFEAGYLGG